MRGRRGQQLPLRLQRPRDPLGRHGDARLAADDQQHLRFPAVGDLDGDGDLEIVVQEGDNTWYGNLLHAWHHDGRYVEGWPIEIAPQWESSRSNPAIADIDHNGKLEIVTQTSDGMLHVLDLHGVEWPGYPRALTAGSISSVQVIDMDMDGVAEFFLCFYASGSQWVSGWRLNGTTLPGFPKLLFANSQLDAHSSAHLADLEGDGDLDLCVQGGTFGAGQVCVYEVPGSTWQEQTGRRDWPKIRRDTANSDTARGTRSRPFRRRRRAPRPCAATRIRCGAAERCRCNCRTTEAAGSRSSTWQGGDAAAQRSIASRRRASPAEPCSGPSRRPGCTSCGSRERAAVGRDPRAW